jgi:hypothetical protein
MEIGPIPGIRVEAVVKVPSAEPELPDVFDVERSREDTWTGDEGKDSGGQDNETEESDDFEEANEKVDASEEELELPPVEQPAESDSSAQVNYIV